MADQIRQRAAYPAMAVSRDWNRIEITFAEHAHLIDALEWLHDDDGLFISRITTQIDASRTFLLSLEKGDNLFWRRCDYTIPISELAQSR